MKRRYGMLALSLGLAIGMVGQAYAVADRTEIEKTKMYRGTNNGQEGTWIEYVTRTYRYVADPSRLAAKDAFVAQFGREPSDAEIDQFLMLKTLGTGLSDKELAAIAANLAAGKVTLDQVKQQLATLKSLAGENPYNKFLSLLPEAFLTSKGAISQSVAQQVGAYGRWQGLDTRIETAYKAIGVDPNTKKFTSGPKAGQAVSGDFSSLVGQLTSGYVTFDWNYDNLIKDLGGASTLEQMARARGAGNQSDRSDLYTGNLTFKDSLKDPSLSHAWNAGVNGDTDSDSAVRSWLQTYDGIGKFNNGTDLDVFVSVAYSTAAKLVAESKALRTMGLAAEADAKVLAARNVVLLTGNNHDPLVLDLNHNGKIDVTGISSAKYRNDANKRFVKDGAVKFDLLANGRPITTEWIKGGDAFLVDNRKNLAVAAIQAGKNLTGANLFGDVEGFPGGFLKLGVLFDQEAKYASDQKVRLSKEFGTLKGAELGNLMAWIDNGDGRATRDELKSMAELGITEISVRPVLKNEKGETLEQTYFVQNGEKHLIQEVWFMGE